MVVELYRNVQKAVMRRKERAGKLALALLKLITVFTIKLKQIHLNLCEGKSKTAK